MDTASYTGKNDGVWWGIFKEYFKQNIITAVLRKANDHSVVICRLIKKFAIVNKNRSKRKHWFKICLGGFIRRNLMQCIYFFTPQEAEIVGNSR